MDQVPQHTVRQAPTALMPLRLLGLSLVFVWDWCLTDRATNVIVESVEEVDRQLTTVFTVVLIVMLILFALFERRIGSLSHHPSVMGSACAASVVGAVLSILVTNEYLPETVLSFVSGILLGYAMAVLTLAWAEVYGRLQSGRVFLFGAISLMVAGALFALIMQSDLPIRIASTIIVPVIGFGLCHLSSRYVGQEDISAHSKVRYRFPWKPVVIMAVCGLAAAFIDMTLYMIGSVSMEGSEMSALVDLAVGIVLVLIIVISRQHLRPLMVAVIAFISMIAGVLAIAFIGADASYASATLVEASSVLMTFFTYALLANICYRHGVSSLWLFGFAIAVHAVMKHLGGIVYLILPDLSETMDSALNLTLMAVAALIATGVVILLWMSERSFNSNWAIERIDLREGARVETERERLLGSCHDIAARYDLTERERTILEMVIAGMSYQEISQSLLLSPNTIKTHKRHMYNKLGVHSRTEVIELVRGQDDTPNA